MLRRNAPGTLVITTAYPSRQALNSARAAADKDWYEFNTDKGTMHILPREPRPIAPWDLDELTPGYYLDKWASSPS